MGPCSAEAVLSPRAAVPASVAQPGARTPVGTATSVRPPLFVPELHPELHTHNVATPPEKPDTPGPERTRVDENEAKDDKEKTPRHYSVQ